MLLGDADEYRQQEACDHCREVIFGLVRQEYVEDRCRHGYEDEAAPVGGPVEHYPGEDEGGVDNCVGAAGVAGMELEVDLRQVHDQSSGCQHDDSAYADHDGLALVPADEGGVPPGCFRDREGDEHRQ